MKSDWILLLLSFIGSLSAALLWSIGLLTTLGPTSLTLLFLMATGASLAAILGAGRHLLRWVRRNQNAPTTSKWTKTTLSLLLSLLAFTVTGHFLHGVFAAGGSEITIWDTSTTPPNEPADLRIINFNALHGYPRFVGQEERYRHTLAALRALEADVIVLQEAWSTRVNGNLAERLSRELQMGGVYARANGSRRYLGFEEGSAILSRYPLISPRRIVLSPRMPPWENRIGLVVTIPIGDELLTIAGTHLSFYSPSIAHQQSTCLAKSMGKVTLVAGDFNAQSESAAVGVFTDQGMIDVVPGGIDHVLIDPALASWTVAAARWTLRPQDMQALIGRAVEISDHPGILVDLVKTRNR